MTGLIALALLTPSLRAPGYQDIVQPNFHDCTFTAKVVKGNQRELQKINRDFATSYRFSFMKAKVKEPFMVRLESTVEDTSVLYVLNGTRKLYRIPKLGIGKVDDVSKAPGKRQTMMDFGVLTPSLFQSLFTATFVRKDRETGALVFDLTYQRPTYDDTSRHRVWVDPDKRVVEKRVWFNQEGRELATFLYENPKEQKGVWFPSRYVVKNVDDKVAGIVEYASIQVNVGLTNDPFKF